MFVEGQRWISEAEPEMGLGTILKVSTREVHILFEGADVSRVYSAESAPLRRVRFRAGDAVKDRGGHDFKVASLREEGGLLFYSDGQKELSEMQLNASLSFSEPQSRLLRQHLDDHSLFELRYRTYQERNRITGSPVYGYAGARIDLIPHQLYVASQVTERTHPRVLLSDEVGLGKTIEAGLILHRKLLTGAATRVLVVVPESLVHQWFVEMYRKFNLWFTIIDEERCRAVTEIDKDVNPFLQEQLVVCSQEFLLQNPQWGMQGIQGEWDLTVIDEAHHILWEEEHLTPEYDFASRLCEASKGVLLLTATPEQLGEGSHFARLKLLAPERFSDLQTFKNEAGEQRLAGDLAAKLLDSDKLSPTDEQALADLLKTEDDCSRWMKNPQSHQREILEALVDRHGPGRMIFRNTRKVMSNFPQRQLHKHALDMPENLAAAVAEQSAQSAADYKEVIDCASMGLGLMDDPRIDWLVEILRKHKGEKFLFICSTRSKVEALEEAFRAHSGAKTVLFHEGLNLMQRDKNAVFFADPDGAAIMFCSEIGSEGRNFQFAHNLILWDLPVLPGLLEQRIGRLDRIGQMETIRIHVPYFSDSVQEVLLNYYHEGLDAFEHSLQGGNFLRSQLQDALLESLEKAQVRAADRAVALKKLLEMSSEMAAATRRRLEEGRDRLLEHNSYRQEPAARLQEAVAESDSDHQLEAYLEEAFDHFGILYEEMSPGTWKVAPGPNISTDALPSLLPEGQMMSLRRQKALHDEQMTFLSWEHPLVGGMMDELLSSEKGNASFALWRDEESRTLLLELVFVAESVAAPELQVSRYLPATPLRVLVNHKVEDMSAFYEGGDFYEQLEAGSPHRVLDTPLVVEQLIPAMLEGGLKLAEVQRGKLQESALQRMQEHESAAIQRLQALARINPAVRQSEIDSLYERRDRLEKVLRQASLRLDAVRFIWKGSDSYFG